MPCTWRKKVVDVGWMAFYGVLWYIHVFYVVIAIKRQVEIQNGCRGMKASSLMGKIVEKT